MDKTEEHPAKERAKQRKRRIMLAFSHHLG